MTNTKPLSGITVVNLAVNVPGPYAAARLHEMGATVHKIEPPSGDPIAEGAPSWYEELARGARVETVDLKSADGRHRVEELLSTADVFITSHRRSTLKKLGLYDASLRHPRLCHVEIVGDVENPDVPGHDLTYQAAAGILTPPALPRIIAGDLTGSEQAVSAALALLYRRDSGATAATGAGDDPGPVGGREVIGLKQTAFAAADSFRHGLTTPDGPLGGRLPIYGLYEVADGWVAVAAVEGHFAARLAAVAGGVDVLSGREPLEKFFAGKTRAEVVALAAEHDLPIEPVR